AMDALRRYQSLRPEDPNALDSMGDVNLLLGRLGDAERFYLEAYKKAPTFMNGLDVQKAALAHLMTGDVAGADAIVRNPGPEWMWIAGRTAQAYEKLSAEAASSPSRDRQAAAYAELAIWSLLRSDRASAGQMAARAVGLVTPATAATVAVV